jgi:hypothetical protein
MKNVLKKLVEHIVRKEFPMFHSVEVSRDRDMRRYFSDTERNYVYNIFLIMTPAERNHLEEETVIKVKKMIYDVIKMIELHSSDISIYIETDG